MFQFYGLPFVISFFISISFCFVLVYFFKKNNCQNVRESVRHIHDNKQISRFGGATIIFSFVLILFLNKDIVFDHLTLVMLIGLVIIFILGVIDDVWELNWKIQLFFQIIIIFLIFHYGIQIEFITNPFGGLILFNSLVSFIFTLIWMLVIINIVNWSDGVDGLMGGIIFFASIALFFLSLRPEVNQPPLAIISIVLSGSILGFLVLIFRQLKFLQEREGLFLLDF